MFPEEFQRTVSVDPAIQLLPASGEVTLMPGTVGDEIRVPQWLTSKKATTGAIDNFR
jgi:hypothetical protein